MIQNCSGDPKWALTRASKALNAIRLIRTHFNQQELLQLVTSNYYSVLYYNSEVWHILTLTHETVMSNYSDKLAHVQVVFNIPLHKKDTLTYISGAPSIDDVMS